MNPFFSSILDIFYPQTCLVCRESAEDVALCEVCRGEIDYIEGSVTSRVMTHYNNIYAVAAYEGVMLEIVHHLKYGRSSAAERIVDEIFKCHLPRFIRPDLIVPIPLHRFRYMKRGYNQASLIAGYISKYLNVPIRRRAVIRCRVTKTQVGKGFNERVANVTGGFKAPRIMGDKISGRVLLVDDVVTSGATVNECARALLSAGAESVDVLTLAKTL